MLEKFFSAPKTLRRLRSGISGPHVDLFADSLEREDTPRPAPFDTFARLPISVVSLRGKDADWRISIPIPLIPLPAIFAAADVLISSAEKSAITLNSE